MTGWEMPCPNLTGGELCSKPAGHFGRCEPGAPEISGRRLQWIRDRYYTPRWWQRQARCPRCHAVIHRIECGEMTGPVVIPAGEGHGPCAEVVSEYTVTFGPCGHQFRRIMRAKDNR